MTCPECETKLGADVGASRVCRRPDNLLLGLIEGCSPIPVGLLGLGWARLKRGPETSPHALQTRANQMHAI